MVRLIRVARRALRRMAEPVRDCEQIHVTDRIDIELAAREEMRGRRRTTLGGAYRW
ncbi:hypothetical protein [Pinisolibacter sp.]|uniref:hypothetical protein n=1 Tax=Pinisolibacter sp. TaxID=2172024 RepID=UPI002FDD3008